MRNSWVWPLAVVFVAACQSSNPGAGLRLRSSECEAAHAWSQAPLPTGGTERMVMFYWAASDEAGAPFTAAMRSMNHTVDDHDRVLFKRVARRSRYGDLNAFALSLAACFENEENNAAKSVLAESIFRGETFDHSIELNQRDLTIAWRPTRCMSDELDSRGCVTFGIRENNHHTSQITAGATPQ